MSQTEIRSIYHKGHNERGVLLLHGFTGTTLEMKPLAEFLRGIGYAIAAPLLAGHGTTPEQLRKTSWQDWLESAEEGYHRLLDGGNKVIYTVGLSMGGLLALKLALKYEFRALATLSSPIFVRDTRIRHTRWLKWVIPYQKRMERKAPHIEQQIIPYKRTPLAAVHRLYELMEEVKLDLPSIKAPIMIAQSGEDETVDPKSADYIYQHIGSNYKKIFHYPNSSHIITLDHDQRMLCMDIAKYFEEITHAVEGK